VKRPCTNSILSRVTKLPETDVIVHDVERVYSWLNIEIDIHVANVDLRNSCIKSS
jgi:hypothetical protein